MSTKTFPFLKFAHTFFTTFSPLILWLQYFPHFFFQKHNFHLNFSFFSYIFFNNKIEAAYKFYIHHFLELSLKNSFLHLGLRYYICLKWIIVETLQGLKLFLVNFYSLKDLY